MLSQEQETVTTKPSPFQETFDRFIKDLSESKAAGNKHCPCLDLSTLTQDDLLAESLKKIFTTECHNIHIATIVINLNQLTDQEMVFIAKYIKELRLPIDSILKMSCSYMTSEYISKLRTFLGLMQDSPFSLLDLSNNSLEYLSETNFEVLYNMLATLSGFKTLRLWYNDLMKITEENLKKLIHALRGSQLGLVDLTRNGFEDCKGNLLEWLAALDLSDGNAACVQLYQLEHSEKIQKSTRELTRVDDLHINLAAMHYSALLAGMLLGLGFESARSINDGPPRISIPGSTFCLSNEEQFKVAQALLSVYKRLPHNASSCYYFSLLTKDLSLDPLDSAQLIRSLIELDPSFSYHLENLKIKECSEEYKSDLFLNLCTRNPFHFYEMEDFQFSFAEDDNQPGHRLLSAFKALNDTEPDSIDADEGLEILVDGCMPLLKEYCTGVFGASLPFINRCIERIESMYQQRNAEDVTYPLLRVIAWLGWVSAKIDSMPSLKPLLEDNARLKTFNALMSQVFNLAHPNMRYTLTSTFLETLCNDDQSYFHLTENRSLDALLPAIPLSAVVLQEKDPTLKDSHYKSVQALLPLLASRQFYGRFQRTMLAALDLIAVDKSLDSSQKIAVIQKIIAKSKQQSDLKALLKEMTLLLERPVNEKNTEIRRIINAVKVYDSILSQKLAVATGHGRFKHLLDTEPPIRIDFFPKAMKPLKEIIVDHYRDAHFDQIMSRFMLVQGLALVGKLSRLASSTNPALADAEDSFETQASSVFKELFGIEDEQFAHYQQTFGKCHNESALLTYYGKLLSLKGEESQTLLEVFKAFVQSVLSPESADFYQLRYDTARSPHLASVFSGQEALRAAWQVEQSTDLVRFVEQHQIVHQAYIPDFEKFISKNIFGHKHMDPQFFTHLQRYLEVTDKIKRGIIKEGMNAVHAAILQAQPVQDTAVGLSIAQKHAALEAALLALIESPIDENESIMTRYDKPIKRLCLIEGLLEKIDDKSVFRHDIEALITGLKGNRKSVKTINEQDFSEYTIVITGHYWRLLMSGTDVEGSCQSVDGNPSLNQCLMGYVVNGHVKMVAILDKEGKIIGRCMLKLLQDSVTQEPVLFLEEVYPSSLRPDLREALIQKAITHARDLNLPLGTIETLPFSYQSDESQEDASLSWGCEGGLAVYEYVDALFEVIEGPYTIDKGIKLLFRPTPKLEAESEAFVNVDTRNSTALTFLYSATTAMSALRNSAANTQEKSPRAQALSP